MEAKSGKMIPSEFCKSFQAKKEGTILYTGEGSALILFIIIFGITVLIVSLSLITHDFKGLWALSVPIIILITALAISDEDVEFNRETNKLIFYRNGIASGNRIYELNRIRFKVGHRAGRITTLTIDIIDMVTEQIVGTMFMGNNDDDLNSCIEYLNDFIAGNPIKEHYILPKKRINA
jgi:hypothetical protein